MEVKCYIYPLFPDIIAISGQQDKYHGILINGYAGTQLYDPFNSPHARGNLTLGLSTSWSAYIAAAVINGPLAYFSGGIGIHFLIPLG